MGAQESEQEHSEEFTTSTSFGSPFSAPDSPHLFHCFQKLPLLDDPRRPWIKDSLTALQYNCHTEQTKGTACINLLFICMFKFIISTNSKNPQFITIYKGHCKWSPFPFLPFCLSGLLSRCPSGSRGPLPHLLDSSQTPSPGGVCSELKCSNTNTNAMVFSPL